MTVPTLAWVRVIAAVSLLCICLAAQTPDAPPDATPRKDAPPKRSKEMKAFVDGAYSAPAEFCADILLKLAESSLITEKQWKIELIEEAFRTAAGAFLPYSKVAYRLSVEALINRENNSVGLDTLTLRLRAVELMLGLDAPRAISMFEDIIFPTLPRETCDNPLTPEIVKYYLVADRIVAGAFSAADRSKGRDVLFMERLIAPLHSHLQAGPALTMILRARVNAADRRGLLAQLASRLAQVGGGDRVFGQAVFTMEPVPDMMSAIAFVPALRRYLVQRTGGPRCSDNFPRRGELPEPVRAFNNLIAAVDPERTQFAPIDVKESTPLVDEGTYSRAQGEQSAYARKVADGMLALTVTSRDTGLREAAPLEQRLTVEWQTRFQETRRLVESWPVAEERSRQEHGAKVASSLSALANMAPTLELRDYLVDSYLTFVESRYSAGENRTFWFSLVMRRLSRSTAGERDGQTAWLSRQARSSNPIIALYAQFEQMAATARAAGGKPETTPVSPGRVGR